MKNCIYLAGEHPASRPWLLTGCGFDAAGDFFLPGGAADADGLVLDDRFPPSPAGAAAAVDRLRAEVRPLVFDLERPPAAPWKALLEALRDRDVTLPPAWAACPHARVLAGPYVPRLPFDLWLARLRARYGPLVLDAKPLTVTVAPRRGPGLPAPGGALFFAPSARALARLTAGGVAFSDDRRTWTDRCRAAGCPCVVLTGEWEALAGGSVWAKLC